MKTILQEEQLLLSIKRLSHQILEQHIDLENTVIIGIQPRGAILSDKIVFELKQTLNRENIQYGKLDITFYRDDIRQGLHIANRTDIKFSTEGKSIILIDDVLWTGRTIRAALDALLAFGRPQSVELCVLINRRFGREVPIQADYIGKSIDTFDSQKVKVYWKGFNADKNEVVLIEKDDQ